MMVNQSGNQLVLSVPVTEEEKAQVTRTVKVISMALVMGVVMFGGLFFFISQSDEPFEMDPTELYFLLASFFALSTGTASLVIPNLLVNQEVNKLTSLSREEQESKLWGLFQTKTIISMALPEGACFFCIIMFFVSNNLLTFLLVPILLFCMFLNFPSRFRIDNWVEAKLGELALRS